MVEGNELLVVVPHVVVAEVVAEDVVVVEVGAGIQETMVTHQVVVEMAMLMELGVLEVEEVQDWGVAPQVRREDPQFQNIGAEISF